MYVLIDGQRYPLTPIRAFRAAYDLPPEFSVAYFQPKSYDGLGSIEGAGAALNSVRDATIAAIPAVIKPSALLGLIPDLQTFFINQLYAINPQVQLKDVEIEFAAAGFGNVVSAFAYALLRSHLSGDPAPDFDVVYQAWLDSSTRIASNVIEYTHADQVWGIQVLADAYGRLGLLVALPDQTVVVHDAVLACPAAGFMAGLLREVCGKINANLAP